MDANSAPVGFFGRYQTHRTLTDGTVRVKVEIGGESVSAFNGVIQGQPAGTALYGHIEGHDAISLSHIKHGSRVDGSVVAELDVSSDESRSAFFSRYAGLGPGFEMTFLVMSQPLASPAQSSPVATKSGGGHGEYWRGLIKSGVFNAEAVCAVIMSDDDYQSAVRAMKSVISGNAPCIYAHVRRASNSGTGFKPRYSGVPLTNEEHQAQHQSGERAVLADYGVGNLSIEAAKGWFGNRAARVRAAVMSQALASKLPGYTSSRADVDPKWVVEWFAENNLTHYLPETLRRLKI